MIGARARRGDAVGRRTTKLPDGAPGDRPATGCSSTWPGCTPSVEVAAADELAGGVGGDAGRARHRPLLGGQGVRHRVLPRGAARLLMEILGPVVVPRSPTRPGAVLRSRLESASTAARSSSRSAAGVNEMQRDLISQFSLGLPEGEPLMDFSFSADQQSSCRDLARQDPRRRRQPRAHRSRCVADRADGSTATCGARSPTPASSASRCPSPRAAAGSASSRRASCSKRSGARPRRCPALAVMGLAAPALARLRRPSIASTGVAAGTPHRHRRAHRAGRRRVRAVDRRRTATAGSPARRCACPRGSTRRGSSSPPIDGLYRRRPVVRRRDRRARGHDAAASPTRGSCCSDAPAEQLAGPEGRRPGCVERAQAAMRVMVAGVPAGRARRSPRRTRRSASSSAGRSPRSRR